MSKTLQNLTKFELITETEEMIMSDGKLKRVAHYWFILDPFPEELKRIPLRIWGGKVKLDTSICMYCSSQAHIKEFDILFRQLRYQCPLCGEDIYWDIKGNQQHIRGKGKCLNPICSTYFEFGAVFDYDKDEWIELRAIIEHYPPEELFEVYTTKPCYYYRSMLIIDGKKEFNEGWATPRKEGCPSLCSACRNWEKPHLPEPNFVLKKEEGKDE